MDIQPPSAIPAETITNALDDLRFPAMHWQVVMAAEEYGADRSTRSTLRELDHRSYTSVEDVVAEVSRRAGIARVCQRSEPGRAQSRSNDFTSPRESTCEQRRPRRASGGAVFYAYVNERDDVHTLAAASAEDALSWFRRAHDAPVDVCFVR